MSGVAVASDRDGAAAINGDYHEIELACCEGGHLRIDEYVGDHERVAGRNLEGRGRLAVEVERLRAIVVLKLHGDEIDHRFYGRDGFGHGTLLGICGLLDSVGNLCLVSRIFREKTAEKGSARRLDA